MCQIIFKILWVIFTIGVMWIEPKTKKKQVMLAFCFVSALVCAIIGF